MRPVHHMEGTMTFLYLVQLFALFIRQNRPTFRGVRP